MAEHKELPELQLHENKGVSTAQANSIATSDGSGRTIWKIATPANLGLVQNGMVGVQNGQFNYSSLPACGAMYVPINGTREINLVANTPTPLYQIFPDVESELLNRMVVFEGGLSSDITGIFQAGITMAIDAMPADSELFFQIANSNLSLPIRMEGAYTANALVQVGQNQTFLPQVTASVTGVYTFAGAYFFMASVA